MDFLVPLLSLSAASLSFTGVSPIETFFGVEGNRFEFLAGLETTLIYLGETCCY